MNPTEEPVIINPDKFVPMADRSRGRWQRTTSPTPPKRKAQFTSEERRFILELIAEAERNADPRYVREVAGFWLGRMTPSGQRSQER